jgi:hypothetical protein
MPEVVGQPSRFGNKGIRAMVIANSLPDGLSNSASYLSDLDAMYQAVVKHITSNGPT